jgi:UDP-2-acetamido-2-deoxy-ribo-hexuluronate aminotransferase
MSLTQKQKPAPAPSAPQTVPFLDLKAQQARIGPDMRRRIDAVLAHCQFVLGPEVAELEAELARRAGAAHCVSVSSGTDALLIAMMAEEIGPGDAVFLPAFTYTATAEVPLLLRATPVFVDIDPNTFQMDVADLDAKVAATRAGGKLRPRAVIGVDLFGQPADWDALGQVALRHGLMTIDDCAQAFGATLHGRPLGSQADCTAISFFPSKPLGGYGDGGALFTESAERAALYHSLRTHGEGRLRYDVQRIGINGRLDTLQAAVLLAKLTTFDAEIAAREAVARHYDRRLGNLLQTPTRVPDSMAAWAVYAVLLPDGATRDRVQAACRDRGVATAVYYPKPLHHQPAYADQHDGRSLPVSEDVATRIMALPIHPDLTEAQLDHVCDVVAGALAQPAFA